MREVNEVSKRAWVFIHLFQDYARARVASFLFRGFGAAPPVSRAPAAGPRLPRPQRGNRDALGEIPGGLAPAAGVPSAGAAPAHARV